MVDAIEKAIKTMETIKIALEEIKKYNPLKNDLDAYFYQVADWGLGILEDHPDAKDYDIAEPLESIMAVTMRCPNCDWLGAVAEAEPDIDGDGSLGCPVCDAILTQQANAAEIKCLL